MLTRKTSRMWRAPARGLPRALTARLLAVVLVIVVVLAIVVFLAIVVVLVIVVVLAVLIVFSVVMAGVLAGVLAVVTIVVWLVPGILGVGVKGAGVARLSSVTDDVIAVWLAKTRKTCRLTSVTVSELGTVHVATTTELLGGVTRYRTLVSLHP